MGGGGVPFDVSEEGELNVTHGWRKVTNLTGVGKELSTAHGGRGAQSVT